MKKTIRSIILCIVIGIPLYWVSRNNYILYHILVEISIAMIGILIFSVSLNSRSFNKVNLLVMLGPGFLVSSLIGMIHSYTYYGMNIIHGYDANLPTQLWIVLSYILAFSFLFTILFHKKNNYYLALISYSALGLLFVLLCFLKLFPNCYIPKTGLTNFKKMSEYIIIVIYIISIILLSRIKNIEKRFYKQISAFIFFLMLSGFFFTLYSDVYGIFNFLGHYTRLWAFIIIYESLLSDLIVAPYKKILFNSIHNCQTGLYNYKYFFEIEENDLINPTIFIFDIDSLKLINNAFGYAKGDFLIGKAGEIINASIPENSIPAQLSGGEFAVLIDRSNEEKINMFINEIGKRLEQYNVENPELPLNITYGFSTKNNRDLDIFKLYQEALETIGAKKVLNIKSSHNTLVKTLIKTLETRDYDTKEHADRMVELATVLAKKINFSENSISGLVLFTQFHDIGKIGISDSILLKPGPLSEDERLIMQKHSKLGYEIAISSSDLAPISDFILKHHERWDGKGYPLGLSGENIPIECRILSIIDAYDALVNDRPYRERISSDEALEEIKRCAGTQFDPKLVDLFIEIIQNG